MHFYKIFQNWFPKTKLYNKELTIELLLLITKLSVRVSKYLKLSQTNQKQQKRRNHKKLCKKTYDLENRHMKLNRNGS